MKKLLFVLLGILVLSLSYRIFIYHLLTSEQQQTADDGRYFLYQFSLPKTMAFAGEKIPLNDAQVRDRMIHLLINNTYSKTQTLMLHKLSARWFPLIEKILKKYDVPDDFKYLAVVESGFGTGISDKGACGFWQFLPKTALHYGLEISGQVDERDDPERSTIAACKYIRDCYKRFNNWTLAAASYNMGPEALLREMKKQKEKSYYDLILNTETSEYLFKVLAMKEIIRKPGLYGYKFNRKQLYAPLPAKTILIDSSITNMRAFAEKNNTTVPLIKALNPWLITDQLINPTHKKYAFKIIKEGAENIPGLLNAPDSISKRDTIVLLSDTLPK
jgi:membrane-bound lytic murein transglycosylase D